MTYYYKDKPYAILLESKFKKDGTWVDCIIYQTEYENPDGTIWVREKEEFFNLFKTKIKKDGGSI